MTFKLNTTGESKPTKRRLPGLALTSTALAIGMLVFMQCTEQSSFLTQKSQWSATSAFGLFAATSTETQESVSNGNAVRIQYSVHPAMETAAPIVRDRKLNFTVGKKHYLPELDEAVIGMVPGESKSLRVPGSRIFGPHHRGLLVPVSKNVLPEGTPLKRGAMVWFTTAGDNVEGHPIVEVNEHTVVIDMNHPYSGKPVVVRFRVTNILS